MYKHFAMKQVPTNNMRSGAFLTYVSGYGENGKAETYLIEPSEIKTIVCIYVIGVLLFVFNRYYKKDFKSSELSSHVWTASNMFTIVVAYMHCTSGNILPSEKTMHGLRECGFFKIVTISIVTWIIAYTLSKFKWTRQSILPVQEQYMVDGSDGTNGTDSHKLNTQRQRVGIKMTDEPSDQMRRYGNSLQKKNLFKQMGQQPEEKPF